MTSSNVRVHIRTVSGRTVTFAKSMTDGTEATLTTETGALELGKALKGQTIYTHIDGSSDGASTTFTLAYIQDGNDIVCPIIISPAGRCGHLIGDWRKKTLHVKESLVINAKSMT